MPCWSASGTAVLLEKCPTIGPPASVHTNSACCAERFKKIVALTTLGQGQKRGWHLRAGLGDRVGNRGPGIETGG